MANKATCEHAAGYSSGERTTIDGSTPQQANALERPSTHEVLRVSTAASAEDEKLAQQWLSSTNQRPAIRVHYDAGDVLRLARLGRGVIVASSKDPANRRELYIQTASSRSPLLGALHVRGRRSVLVLQT